MSLSEILFAASSVLSFLLLIIVAIHYHAAKNKTSADYTREKFAFRVFVLIASLCSTLITLLVSGPHLFVYVVSIVAEWVGVDASKYQPSLSDKALATILIFGLIYLALTLHRN